jgi:hypothetical protein
LRSVGHGRRSGEEPDSRDSLGPDTKAGGSHRLDPKRRPIARGRRLHPQRLQEAILILQRRIALLETAREPGLFRQLAYDDDPRGDDPVGIATR